MAQASQLPCGLFSQAPLIAVMTSIKARIDPAQLPQAANHQSGTDEENERQRYFGNHQRATRPVSAELHICPAKAPLQRVVQIALRRAQGWRQPGHHSSQQRDGQGESQYPGIHSDIFRAGHALRQKSNDQPNSEVRDQEAYCSASQRKHYSFRENLPQHPNPARAQRRPDGNP